MTLQTLDTLLRVRDRIARVPSLNPIGLQLRRLRYLPQNRYRRHMFDDITRPERMETPRRH